MSEPTSPPVYDYVPPPVVPLEAATLQDMALKLAAITDLLERRAQEAVQQVGEGAQQLSYASYNLSQQGQQIATEVTNVITGQARQAIDQGSGEALEQLRQQLKQVGESATQSAKLIGEQAQALKKSQKRLVWGGGTALLVGCLLAAGGSAYVAWRSLHQLQRAEFAEDILMATRTGTISRCDKQLCVRVGAEPKRFGKDGEYILLQE
jgi:2-oxoglutarate dehydrogenase complex dehydrogenase (E1) component-like enzyme